MPCDNQGYRYIPTFSFESEYGERPKEIAVNLIAFHQKLAAQVVATVRSFFFSRQAVPDAVISPKNTGCARGVPNVTASGPSATDPGDEASHSVLMREQDVGFNAAPYTFAENQFDKLIDAIRHAQELQGNPAPPTASKE